MARGRLRRHADGEIGDDALSEVLARVRGLRDLIRCAATCKRWRRLVGDRHFLRRVGLWPDTARRPCILAGIFSQNVMAADKGRAEEETEYAVPNFMSLQAGLDIRRDLILDSFVTHDDDGLFDLARPLAARRGLLLVRILLPCPPNDYGPEELHLAVCRPLVDGRSKHLLPPAPFDVTGCSDKNLIGCAILTAADYAAADEDLVDRKQQLQKFQVLLIYNNEQEDSRVLYACTYSSDGDTTGSWSTPVELECCSGFWLTKRGPRAGIVSHGGIVHWLFRDNYDRTKPIYTLSVTATTSHASLTKIPFKVHKSSPPIPFATRDKTRAPWLIPCIIGEERRLSFVTIRDSSVVDLWTKLGQGDDDWQCSELVKLGSKGISIAFFAESRGALLIKQGDAFSIIDLKGKEVIPVHIEKDQGAGHFTDACYFPGSCSSSCCSGHRLRGDMCEYIPPVLYEMDIRGL